MTKINNFTYAKDLIRLHTQIITPVKKMLWSLSSRLFAQKYYANVAKIETNLHKLVSDIYMDLTLKDLTVS